MDQRAARSAIVTTLLLAVAWPACAAAQPVLLPACTSEDSAAVGTLPTSDPTVGQEREVEVGGVLLASGDRIVAEAGLKLTAEASFTGRYAGADFTVTIPPVTVTTADVRNGTYQVPAATFRYAREKGGRHGGFRPTIGLFDSQSGRTLHANVSFGLKAKDYEVPGATFEQLRCQRLDPHEQRSEIIYSGAAKGVLTLTYREYAGDLARPAFSQQATFDLAEGNEIGFKGVRFRIVKTSNVGVRYVVTALPDGGTPAQPGS